MKLTIFNTHMEVTPYVKEDIPYIEKIFTALDRFSAKEYACAYMIFNNTLYIPKGSPVGQFKSFLESVSYDTNIDPFDDMDDDFKSLYKPRNKLQQESIDFLSSEENGCQLALNLATGFGKTFCVAYASTQMKLKTIIITPNESLKSRWIKTYSTMFDYRPKHLMNISGSNIISDIMDGSIEANREVYFVNHQTLRSYMIQYAILIITGKPERSTIVSWIRRSWSVRRNRRSASRSSGSMPCCSVMIWGWRKAGGKHGRTG